ncbi:MAG: signal recognition particle receptor subunit alpha, partial [Bacteroidota bacterium]
MFESLSSKLDKAFKTLKGQGKITEINVAETIKEIRKALLDADVNYKIAKQFTDTVKEKALGQNVLTAVSPGQLLVKIVNDELALLLGGQTADVNLNGNPAIILMAGLQGSGKTTHTAKLASFIKKKGKSVMMAAADVYRPAAIEQLKVLGAQIDVPVYFENENKNPVSIAQNALKKAKEEGVKVLIVDTAGRLSIDEEKMAEIGNIKKALSPQEILFVV